MIDLNSIKDEKPRKGPARMSKSEKDVEARRRHKDEARRDRLWQRQIKIFSSDFRALNSNVERLLRRREPRVIGRYQRPVLGF